MKSVSFFKDYRKENPKIFPFVFKNILHQMAGQEMKDKGSTIWVTILFTIMLFVTIGHFLCSITSINRWQVVQFQLCLTTTSSRCNAFSYFEIPFRKCYLDIRCKRMTVHSKFIFTKISECKCWQKLLKKIMPLEKKSFYFKNLHWSTTKFSYPNHITLKPILSSTFESHRSLREQPELAHEREILKIENIKEHCNAIELR